jgi:hypothetical protein
LNCAAVPMQTDRRWRGIQRVLVRQIRSRSPERTAAICGQAGSNT